MAESCKFLLTSSDLLTCLLSYLDYNLQYQERNALAMLFCFCVRLHSEQLGYIYKFLERHLSLCNTTRTPHTWQESLDPEEDAVGRQKSSEPHYTLANLGTSQNSELTNESRYRVTSLT